MIEWFPLERKKEISSFTLLSSPLLLRPRGVLAIQCAISRKCDRILRGPPRFISYSSRLTDQHALRHKTSEMVLTWSAGATATATATRVWYGGGAAFHNPLCPVPIKRCCHAYGQELTGRSQHGHGSARIHARISIVLQVSLSPQEEQPRLDAGGDGRGRGWGGLRFDWGASGSLDVPAIIGPGYLQPYTARSRTREYVNTCFREWETEHRTGTSNTGKTKGEREINKEKEREREREGGGGGWGEVWLCKCARILAACVIIEIVDRQPGATAR